MSSHRRVILRDVRWQQRLYGYLALARISNSPTVVSNVLAGAALAGARQPNGTLALLGVAMVLFYTAGMFLNDLCDYAADRRERPDRPLPSGTVPRTAAAAAVVALFGAGSIVLWYVGLAPFLSGILLIGLIVTYDMWHKANPFSPLVMAGTRLMVYVVAFLAFSPRVSGSLAAAGGLLALYVVGLTYVAKSETGPSFTRYWPATLLFLPVGCFALWVPSVSMLPLLLLFAGWVAYSISFLYRSKGRSIGGGVTRLIAGIALYDALVLGAFGALSGVMLALLAFGLTLFLQRYIKGT